MSCETCPASFVCMGAGCFHAYSCLCGRMTFVEYDPQRSVDSWDNGEDLDEEPVVLVVYCTTWRDCGRHRWGARCPRCSPADWKSSEGAPPIKLTDYTKAH